MPVSLVCHSVSCVSFSHLCVIQQPVVIAIVAVVTARLVAAAAAAADRLPEERDALRHPPSDGRRARVDVHERGQRVVADTRDGRRVDDAAAATAGRRADVERDDVGEPRTDGRQRVGGEELREELVERGAGADGTTLL